MKMKSEKRGRRNFIKMIDITSKEKTLRSATASVNVLASPALLKKMKAGALAKGDCLTAAQAAGILGAKNTSGLIPLCHPIALSYVAVDFVFFPKALKITAVVKALDATGVEMEALVACALAALTIYDMGKAEEPGIVISDLKLVHKTGGKHHYLAKNCQSVTKQVRPVLSHWRKIADHARQDFFDQYPSGSRRSEGDGRQRCSARGAWSGRRRARRAGIATGEPACDRRY
jgi:cyclic pyranopterin phosphate synthase